MRQYYKGTNPLISLDTGIDLAGGSTPEIHYQTPAGSTGEWPGTISGSKIEYQTSGDDIGQAGIWRFQAAVTINNNLTKGAIVPASIENPIKED